MREVQNTVPTKFIILVASPNGFLCVSSSDKQTNYNKVLMKTKEKIIKCIE